MTKFTVGDRVVANRNTSPTSYIGEAGVVVAVNVAVRGDYVRYDVRFDEDHLNSRPNGCFPMYGDHTMSESNDELDAEVVLPHEYKIGDRVVTTKSFPHGFAGAVGTVVELGDHCYAAKVDFDSPIDDDDGGGWWMSRDEIAPLRECEIGTYEGVNFVEGSKRRFPSAKVLNDAWQARVDAATPEGSKPTNPKDIVGSRKVPSSVVPQNVMALVACGLSEGTGKYGRHNYRGAGVRASVYYDANSRHMDDWWEGEDVDPDSQLHHVIKAICSNIVLADSILRGNMTDDRPPPSPKGWMAEANAHAARMADKAAAFAAAHGAPHHWTINDEIPS